MVWELVGVPQKEKAKYKGVSLNPFFNPSGYHADGGFKAFSIC